MYVVMEENHAGSYVVGFRGGDDVYEDRTAALRARDDYQNDADEAGAPALFRVYELREVRGGWGV